MTAHWLADTLVQLVLGIMGLGMLAGMLDCLHHARRYKRSPDRVRAAPTRRGE
ncbi:hypothetical protein KRX52_19675 [Pseudomonas sp. MAP12]|uniref:Uncharacterized protein n=1 Tax=Geopseudomonas aromaticivorans TaxID=2849492 RepID=A0ABS6N1R9_9GAMM|nr:hypothetical protein [Pseudomonas aromaticivorans]MBV2134995.1 hypothetical protein [Pseudomonas aromaticivorans]